jgi:3-phytase
MRRLLRGAWCAPLIAGLLLVPWPGAAQEQPLRFLGELDIPSRSVEVDGTTVGGLSGLAYDARRNVYYVISDDRGEFGPARFYTLRIALGLDGVRDVQFVGVTPLDSDAATPGIQPYETNESDTEEILLMPDDTLLISSERDRAERPWLRRFALDGSLLEDWPIPDLFVPAFMQDTQGRNVQTRGVRGNLGFEGVTFAPDENAVYAMNEEALAQDGPISTPAAGTSVRLLRYGLSSGSPVPGRQVVYHTERIFATPIPADQFADNGVSALMFIRQLLPQYDFLAMERSFVTGVGNDVNIYGVRTEGAGDVSGVTALPQPFGSGTVQKTLLVNMASLGITADNLEGIAQGPRLQDGRIALLVISDDNFSDIQTNQFLLFSIAAPAGK